MSNFATLWTVVHQDPLSMGYSQARLLEWIAIPSSRENPLDSMAYSKHAIEVLN